MLGKRRLSVQPTRKDGGRVFVKRPDPHEEALMILQGQMSHPAAAPGTQVRGGVWLGQGGTEAKRGPGEPQEPAAPEHSLWGGTGPQRGRGPGEASDQHGEAVHGAHAR